MNDQNLAYQYVLPETECIIEMKQMFEETRTKITSNTLKIISNTIKAFHKFSLLAASRIGGAHLKRVSPSGISSAEKAK